ncbi:MAG TPA: PLP-dependent aminotransferase family protein [Pyrinomonadaceae bacterium]|jgi:GntR family transcriptional regulator/MocR family aminotransferase
MTELPFLMFDEKTGSALPLYRQIYENIRRAILSGKLVAGTRLPASRALASQFSVSRLTVVNAFEQLLAEGYLEGRTGAGTFVASKLPEDLLQIPDAEKKTAAAEASPGKIRISKFAARLGETQTRVSRLQNATAPVPFKNGLTAVPEFPFGIWEKIAARVCRQARYKISGYGEAAGYRPLREAVARHFAASRGVQCDTEQIFITNGAQQALDLTARVLLDERDKIWIEDPCYQEALGVFRAVGAEVVPVPVDGEGFDLKEAEKRSGAAKLVYITPSHQYPTGVTMSLARRLELLEWARKTGGWIIEDDYNSEFRYAGRPLASLQNLDRRGRVIYVGTFSKTIFPALRLGCMVVPRNLVEIFRAARNSCDSHSPIFEQAILAEFISEGHFARHLRRMRTLYEKRQRFLVAEAEKELAGLMKVSGAPAGMHLIGWLADGFDEFAVAEKASENGLNLSPLSSYCIENKLPAGVILGYTGFDEKEIREGVRKLRKVISLPEVGSRISD